MTEQKQDRWTEFTFELHQSAAGPRGQTLPWVGNKAGKSRSEAQPGAAMKLIKTAKGEGTFTCSHVLTFSTNLQTDQSSYLEILFICDKAGGVFALESLIPLAI